MKSKCIEIKNDKKIVFVENRRKFIASNNEQKEVKVYKIDRCLIENILDQKACDYGLKSSAKFYFIELKGINIIKACQQINATIEYFKANLSRDISSLDLIATIVPTKNSVPKLKTNPDYVKLSKKVAGILIKSKILEIKI